MKNTEDELMDELNPIPNSNRPAHPCYREEGGLGGVEHSGLTKRELISGMAMTALLTGAGPNIHNTTEGCACHTVGR